jgi:hypothetical protein
MPAQSPGTSNEKQLLTYWIVYSSLGCIEYFLHRLLDLLQFYWLGKCIFLIWFRQSGSSSIKISSDSKLIDVSKEERTVPRMKLNTRGLKTTQLTGTYRLYLIRSPAARKMIPKVGE